MFLKQGMRSSNWHRHPQQDIYVEIQEWIIMNDDTKEEPSNQKVKLGTLTLKRSRGGIG